MKIKSFASGTSLLTGFAVLAVAAGVGLGWITTYNYGDFSTAVDDQINASSSTQGSLAEKMLASGVTSVHHKSGKAEVQFTLKGGQGETTVQAAVDETTPAFEVTAYEASETEDHQWVGPIAVSRTRVDKEKFAADQVAALIRSTVETGLANYKVTSDTEAHRVSSWAADNQDDGQAAAKTP